jgi:hypothetical protein
MDVLDVDVDETPIRRGIKIVLGAWLGNDCVDVDFPYGAFMAIDSTGEGREATLDDLGSRVDVLYFSRSEI